MHENPSPSAFPAPSHNHAPCLLTALDRAQSAFQSRGLKLTALRQRVLEEIAASHHAVGAYDLLDRLARKGHRLAPISVYRALDALLEARVIHRLESRNAFFACHAAHTAGHRQVFLVCERCSRVAEVEAEPILTAIEAAAADAGFQTRRTVVEVTGHCADCKGSEQETP